MFSLESISKAPCEFLFKDFYCETLLVNDYKSTSLQFHTYNFPVMIGQITYRFVLLLYRTDFV